MAPILVKSLKELEGLLPSTNATENLQWCYEQATAPELQNATSEEAMNAFKLYTYRIKELMEASKSTAEDAATKPAPQPATPLPPPIPGNKPKLFATETGNVTSPFEVPYTSGLGQRFPPTPADAPKSSTRWSGDAPRSPVYEDFSNPSHIPKLDRQPRDEASLFKLDGPPSSKPRVALPFFPKMSLDGDANEPLSLSSIIESPPLPPRPKFARTPFEAPLFSRAAFEASPYHDGLKVAKEQENKEQQQEQRQDRSLVAEDGNMAAKEAETANDPLVAATASSSSPVDIAVRIKPAAPVEKTENFAAKAMKGLPKQFIGKGATLKLQKTKQPEKPKSTELWTRSKVLSGVEYVPFPPILKDDLEGLNRHAFDESQQWPDQRATDQHGNPVFAEPELQQYLVKDETTPKRKGTRQCLSVAHARMTYHPRLLKEPQRLKQFHEDHGIYIQCTSCHADGHKCNHGRPCSRCQESKQTCKYIFIADFETPEGVYRPPPMLCKFGVRCYRVHAHVLHFFNWCQMVFPEHGSELENKPLFEEDDFAWYEKDDWSVCKPWPDEYKTVPVATVATESQLSGPSKATPTPKPATTVQATTMGSLRPPDRGQHRKLGGQ